MKRGSCCVVCHSLGAQRKMIMYSSLVHDDEDAKYESPWQVAAGTPGNHRFGALLKNLRERSGLSPQQLAEQADVHVSFVRGIERGAQAPSVATARPMLACMKEQDRIQWMDSGPYDLLVRDPTIGRDVAFKFTAKVKGQNRRTDVDPAVRGAAALMEFMPQMPSLLAKSLGPRADVVRHAGDGQPRWSAPADDARFGRVVRMLAAADEEVLGRVESLLRDELGPGQSGS